MRIFRNHLSTLKLTLVFNLLESSTSNSYTVLPNGSIQQHIIQPYTCQRLVNTENFTFGGTVFFHKAEPIAKVVATTTFIIILYLHKEGTLSHMHVCIYVCMILVVCVYTMYHSIDSQN